MSDTKQISEKELIKYPVKYKTDCHMIFDADGQMICHLMWNTHRPNWKRVDEAGTFIADAINNRAQMESVVGKFRDAAYHFMHCVECSQEAQKCFEGKEFERALEGKE